MYFSVLEVKHPPYQMDSIMNDLPPKAPKKRQPEFIQILPEPEFTPVQAATFQRGISYFNLGEYWKAHEAWEMVWRAMADQPDEDAEIVLRGLIQLAAALHCHQIGKITGARNNLLKSLEKLSLCPDQFLGINIRRVRERIRTGVLDDSLEITL